MIRHWLRRDAGKYLSNACLFSLTPTATFDWASRTAASGGW